jgi:hypothetical protein
MVRMLQGMCWVVDQKCFLTRSEREGAEVSQRKIGIWSLRKLSFLLFAAVVPL